MKMTRATMSDLPQIMVLVENAKTYMHLQNNYQWDASYPLKDVFASDISKGELFVYKAEGKLICFICINNDLPSEYKSLKWTTSTNCMVIHRMVTNVDSMGKGLARKMMKFAIKTAKENGYQSIWTDTNSKNNVALYLFESLGFQFVGNIVLRQKPDLFCCYELELS